jgi:glycosyltransferase involved in cell wall biosynthesis
MDILEWASYHAADACIGLSPGIVEGITRRGIDKKNVIMVPNGCDLDIFKPGNGQKIKIEGVNEGDFSAIFTGTHGIANGLYAVLDTASVLKKRDRRDIKLIFIGDGKLKPGLKERAKKEELLNCIFLDPVPKKQLAKLLQTVNAGMMILDNVPAFYYGTSPNKFFDYIASGLPVINNYPGWLADMITENRCGTAVSPDDPEAFADALEYMADNRDKLVDMGANARRLAERSFDRKILTEMFADWLEKVYGE